MKDYLKRLVELAVAGFVTGAGGYVVTNGVHLDSASLRGLVVAAGLAAYGAIFKNVGAKDRPTIK